MKLPLRAPRLVFALAPFACAAASIVACGSDTVSNPNYGAPPEAGAFDPGQGGSGGPYGSGGGAQPGQPGSSGGPIDAGPPVCSDDLKRCAEQFTYPFAGETSVELRGDYRDGAWTKGDP